MPENVEPIPRLSPRSPQSHKGNFGRALIVGGSRGMSGAVTLAGMAALRSGAGLVELAVPDVCQAIVAGAEPSYMTAALESDPLGRIADSKQNRQRLAELLQRSTAAAVGPGLGRADPLDSLVEWLYRECPVPLVVDADGLNALAALADKPPPTAAARLLTPHPGEFARLTGEPAPVEDDLRAARAARFSNEWNVTLILKGHHSQIHGQGRAAVNTTGNPGMATGGTGDVLTGIVTALVAGGMAPFDAARLAAHVHGRAGDLAAADLTETSLIARDLVDYLPRAFRECE